MRRRVLLFFAASAVFAAVCPAIAQEFLPETIQFKGAPEYSDAELLKASGLEKGVVISYANMNAVSKTLMNTGVFSTLAFKFDGRDLIFTLTPSTDLYPIRLENLPLTPGEELNASLHDQFPLYHGKVPAESGLTESVRGALEKMLSDQGLRATVVAAPDLAANKVTDVNYSISSPQVLVSVSGIDGVSAPYREEVGSLVNKALDFPFDTANTAGNLERAVEQFYDDRGYAAAKIQASRQRDPYLASGAIVVPFSIHVEEGRKYQVKSIQLPPEAPVTQAEIDKALAPVPNGPPMGVGVRSIWVLISSRYKSKGYLDCKVTPHATVDNAAGTVSYTVNVDPGPVYHLGFVKFDNVSDALRTLLIHNWEMMPGDPFDESYVADFIVKVQMQDPVLRRSLAGVKANFDASADPQTHIVNLVIRLER
jgi:outer membrane protein insertion porin family